MESLGGFAFWNDPRYFIFAGVEVLFERGRENGKIVNVDFVAFLRLFWDVLLKRER